MNRNDCEAVLNLHRAFRPRRRTGRGFLTGTVFLDAALLLCAFVLATSPFVLKSGIQIDLPVAEQTAGVQFNDSVLLVSSEGRMFFNDELVTLETLQGELRDNVVRDPFAALILKADQSIDQSIISRIYDAAAAAGFRKILLATRTP